MIIQTEVKGYFAENAYFYIDDRTGHGFLIDPGAQAEGLLAMIREHGWTIEKILLTHGHTTDSVIFYSERDKAAFVGDTIFKGSIGNWQYPGGNLQDLQRSIIEKIFTLPDETALFSGHSDRTTVGTEKRRYQIS